MHGIEVGPDQNDIEQGGKHDDPEIAPADIEHRWVDYVQEWCRDHRGKRRNDKQRADATFLEVALKNNLIDVIAHRPEQRRNHCQDKPRVSNFALLLIGPELAATVPSMQCWRYLGIQ